MAVLHHSARIFLDLYKAGPELRSTLKTLIQFYPLEINKPLDAGGNTLLPLRIKLSPVLRTGLNLILTGP